MLCYCGCGTYTTSGRWVRGHAGALRNRLAARVRHGDSEAREQMLDYGWALPKQAELRNFGVEAEFFGIDSGSALTLLRRAGIEADDDGYHHHARPYWRVTDDSSVNGEGNELVSPILGIERAEHAQQVTRALTALESGGAVVDATCGLHVHHDIQHMTPQDVAETVAHYALFQPAINSVLHPARVGNSYGMPMSRPREWYENISALHNYAELRREGSGYGRYHAINMQAIRDHGTLEFRQHAGTLKPNVALTWARFTRLFIDVAKRHTLEDAMTVWPDPSRAPIEEVALYLGAPSTLLDALTMRRDYYQTRSLWGTEDRNLEYELDGYYEEEEQYCEHCDDYGHEYHDCETRGPDCGCYDCEDNWPSETEEETA